MTDYESPITKIVGEIQSQMIVSEEGEMLTHVRQSIGYNIDKDELLKALQYDRNQYEQGYKDGIPKWISVGDRLPEEGTYLVTVERMVGTPRVDIKSFAKDLYSVDEFDFYNKKRKSGWYDYDSEYGYWEDEKVIAWMPLPEPYKEEGDT